jgi:expansin (peptidoglycan-binding protein)
LDLYAAIRGRPNEPLKHRHDMAKVCLLDNPQRCVTVEIVDCNCGANANLIDLYADAFKQLAPLSRGNIKVKLTWL